MRGYNIAGSRILVVAVHFALLDSLLLLIVLLKVMIFSVEILNCTFVFPSGASCTPSVRFASCGSTRCSWNGALVAGLVIVIFPGALLVLT